MPQVHPHTKLYEVLAATGSTMTEPRLAKADRYVSAILRVASEDAVQATDEAGLDVVFTKATKLEQAARNAQGKNGTCLPRSWRPAFTKVYAQAFAGSHKAPETASTTGTTTGSAGTTAYHNDGKGRGWQARSANRAKRNGGVDPLAVASTPAPVSQPTVDSLSARVDSIEAKLDAILAKLA